MCLYVAQHAEKVLPCRVYFCAAAHGTRFLRAPFRLLRLPGGVTFVSLSLGTMDLIQQFGSEM